MPHSFPASSSRYGIALGSNLGDRLANLRDAVSEMQRRAPGMKLVAVAPVYETAPVDCPEGSRAFYNTVVEMEGCLPPLELIEILLGIEEDLGRQRQHGWHEPRTVDLDLLYAGDITLNTSRLTLPHPRMAQRRFVLEPLAQIRPALVLPWQSQTVRELLTALNHDEPAPVCVATDWVADHDRSAG